MARKFGKKKEVNLNPLSYNIGLAGLSGVGKSTLINEVCQKLVGDDGYIMLDIGKESGHDCLNGIISERVENWDKLDEVLDDIIENRTTDYKDLQVVVFDTLDELFILGEEEAIARWNRNNPDRYANSINSVDGGYGRGLDACVDLVLNRIWSLKEVGISFVVIMHTKAKDVEDPITGQMYQVITANMSQKYFNSIKTKLDILGVAYIDREIIKEKLNRKDIKGKEVTRNIVSSESRKIAFRSDDYNLDSKCRFPQIVSEIDMDADQFIKAIRDAIMAEHNKSGKSYEQSLTEQTAAEEERMKQIAEAENKAKESKAKKQQLDDAISKIKTFCATNKGNKNAIMPLVTRAKELGYNNPMEVNSIEDAGELLKVIA